MNAAKRHTQDEEKYTQQQKNARSKNLHPNVSFQAYEQVKDLLESPHGNFYAAERLPLSKGKGDEHGLSKNGLPNSTNENPLYAKEMGRRKQLKLPCADNIPCKDKFSKLNGDIVLVSKMCRYGEDGDSGLTELCPATCNYCNMDYYETPSGVEQRRIDLNSTEFLSDGDQTSTNANETAESMQWKKYLRSKAKRVDTIIEISDIYSNSILNRIDCINRHEDCAIWAADFGCETNLKVLKMCGAACVSCHLEHRHTDKWYQTPFERFDLLGIFDSIKFDMLGSSIKGKVYEPLQFNFPVALFDNVLSSDECDHIITLANEKIAEREDDDKNEISMQTIIACHLDSSCMDDSTILNLKYNLANATGIPPKAITDKLYIEKYDDRQSKSSIMDLLRNTDDGKILGTIMIVLSLNTVPPDSGGSFVFPKLNMSFNSVQGRAIMFPLKEDLHKLVDDDHAEFADEPMVNAITKYRIFAIVDDSEKLTQIMSGNS